MGYITRIDTEILDTLKEVMEDDFQVLIDTFLSDTVVRIDSLRAALTETDADLLRRSAHSLKGSCSNIGVQQLAVLCAQMEEKGFEEDFTGTEQILADIEQEYSLVRQDLQLL